MRFGTGPSDPIQICPGIPRVTTQTSSYLFMVQFTYLCYVFLGFFCIIGKVKKLSTYIIFRAESFTVSGLSPPKDDGALKKSNILIK